MSLHTDNENNGPQPFIRQDAPAKRQTRPTSGGLGCALLGMVIVLVVILVGVALFLPPFSLGDRLFNTPYAQLNQTNAFTQNGLTIALDPANPGNGFGVRLKVLSPQVFNGQTAASAEDTAWLKAARASLPQSLTLLSPLYQIDTQGTAPGVVLSIAAPQGADLALVDLFRYDAQVNRWLFVAAHPSQDNTALVASLKTAPGRIGMFLPRALAPVVAVAVDVGQNLKPALVNVATIVHPSGLQPSAAGSLQGVLPAGVETGHGFGVVPIIRNFSNPAAVDVATVTTLLENSGLRAVHVERLVEFASTRPYQGIAIDYRRIPADQRDNFTAFITALAEKMHNANHTLMVVAPFPTQNGGGFDTGAYDWRALGAVADNLEIVLPLDPQSFVEKGLVDSVLKWAVGEVNRARLFVSLSALSVQETAGSFTSVGAPDALAPLGQIGIKPPGIVTAGNPIEINLTGYRAVFVPPDSSGTPSIQYFAPDGTLAGTMWLTTDAVFARRLTQIGAFNLSGVFALDLVAPGASTGAADMLAAYKVNQLTVPAQSALTLRWLVLSGGRVIAEATSIPGTPFVYKPGDTVQIAADLMGAASTLGPVTVRVAAPTPTYTPLPQPTTAPVGTQPASGASNGGAASVALR